MPSYDFRCLECNKTFTATMSWAEFDKGKPKCPKCGKRKVEQVFGEVLVKTSKKS
ncbi:MAG: zinc ribbon domain-containing protein [Planctomycetes bacterium]|nr:zinc ribbon domain-containing protein [Planctomycetota bacterium]